jgi:hypothetical protein
MSTMPGTGFAGFIRGTVGGGWWGRWKIGSSTMLPASSTRRPGPNTWILSLELRDVSPLYQPSMK